ncbi:regulation of ligase [Desmophyllum pertusum]|uniref:Regulation of ligase n=1 Tax=Desmophyllum pertusum TaxID=174260 RepID=A0A9W9ZMU8_9CNID|nr:regulation of ligase [Desmophyllum pertusum]
MMSSSLLYELLNGMSSTVRELNLSHTSFVLDFSAILPLKCLTHLDISNTPVDDKAMCVAWQYLDCLECINVSNTNISETVSFGNLRRRLKTLLAYNAPVAWVNPVEFSNFGCLQKLDISRNPDNMPSDAWYHNAKSLENMLADPQILPCLVTGEANEQQILSSLRAYPDRAAYMTEALHGLFHITKNWTERKPEVLQLVLPPLEKHPEDLRVQMAATACVFNTSEEEQKKMYIQKYLSKIASLVLSAMSVFPDKRNLLRNCLLILETRQILKKATFNHFEASSRVMDALCLFSSDQDIFRLATKLCAILSSKISAQETLALGTETNITTLFNITKEKIATNQADFTFNVALSVLWNLTDEAPSTCLLFVQKGGLEMMAQGLKVFNEGAQEQNVVIIKKKILGTLNNITEVPSLRQDLITDEFMDLFGSLLADGPVELSYFCGGILSNVMLECKQAVTSWEFPAEELVAYRSFSHLFHFFIVQCLQCRCGLCGGCTMSAPEMGHVIFHFLSMVESWKVFIEFLKLHLWSQ